MLYRSIRELADDIRSGMTTPGELVSEALERIEALDGELQAFVTVMRDAALQAAEEAEHEQRRGFFRGPLHGIPIAVKDLIAVRGERLTAGSRVLADYVAPEDASVVEHLRRHGAIIIGKTNTHEFGLGVFTPPTRNPWKRDHVPGGSSGGSAVAVAAGMCVGAIGTDTGGSIRIPAACCGVTGLKPTYGRVSCHGVIPLSRSLDHVGPLARSAEDCAFIFDAIAGYDPRDPESVSGPPSRSSALLIEGPEGRGPLSLQGLRLGLPPEDFVAPLDPEVRAAWRAAVLIFQEAGAHISEVSLSRPSLATFRTIQLPEAAFAHRERGWLSERAALYGPLTLRRLQEGERISAVDYLRAQQERRVFSTQLRSVLQRVDALVLPAQPMPAIPIAQIDQEITIEGQREDATTASLRLTLPFNLAGLPAVAFPCGFSQAGLPLSLQAVGNAFDEATVLRIAHAYQQLTDWHRRDIP
ncbi:MAG: amidase [Thermogemmatispora sp.]|uniref:amidase n=1 Tax=Thermogemmatispora sp. TaxID=1968838 RepID=UPI002601BFA9|nr:amidase [Thermogemmatispora sp.]MBX5456678.1 amidase [Thermogemmatispora sp.]